jgi:hypothetical protein
MLESKEVVDPQPNGIIEIWPEASRMDGPPAAGIGRQNGVMIAPPQHALPSRPLANGRFLFIGLLDALEADNSGTSPDLIAPPYK